jgi:hypothetical protein
MSSLRDSLEQAATDPKSASADGVSVTQHGLRERIEAEKHLDTQTAARGTRLPVRIAKVRSGPPGGGAR